MTLSAQQLNTFQHCRRATAIEREYRFNRHHPRTLFEEVFRSAIYKISNGADPTESANEAVAEFLAKASSPGLDVSFNPYTFAWDFCSILKTSLEAVSRLTLLRLHPPPLVKGWQCSAYRDDSGLLHRWAAVSRWDQDTQYRQFHSWEVFGDCAATEVGMMLHVVEIGRQAGHRQATPWARAYRHPTVAGRYRFQKENGQPLEGDWRPVWFQDSKENEARVWVDLMEKDRVQLIHHVDIREPKPEHVEQFWREAADEGTAIQALRHWTRVPMQRRSCDIPGECQYQGICYQPQAVVEAGLDQRYVQIKPATQQK